MEPPWDNYDTAEYIETTSGNKVSRLTLLCGSQNIVLNAQCIVQSGVIIRGDLAHIQMGRFCVISQNTFIRPPFKLFSEGAAFFPLSIGDHVYVGENSSLYAAEIGSCVYIGKDVVIGRRCIVSSCCIIEDGARLSADTVIPPFTMYAGSPAQMVEHLPEDTQEMMKDFTETYYDLFVPSF